MTKELTTIVIESKDRNKIKTIQERLKKIRSSRPISTQEAIKCIFNVMDKHKMWGEIQ